MRRRIATVCAYLGVGMVGGAMIASASAEAGTGAPVWLGVALLADGLLWLGLAGWLASYGEAIR